MGAKTIIRQKTIRYHHLDDIRVTKIITKVSLRLAIQEFFYSDLFVYPFREENSK